MVDDSSSDGTRALIMRLADKFTEKFPDVRIVQAFHDRNLGGGAARNTAVAGSTGDVIFCLDSDDVLPEGTLGRMLAFLDEKECDAVSISTSIKFKSDDVTDIAYRTEMDFIGEEIPFTSLLDSAVTCGLYSTFMHTRKAFDIAGGYPTHHGFDTQGFAARFLSKGLLAYGCPDAAYLQRISHADGYSYYLREYFSGKASYNWAFILDEMIHLFNRETWDFILNYRISDDTLLLDTLQRMLGKQELYGNAGLVASREQLAESWKELDSIILDAKDPYKLYWKGANLYIDKKNPEHRQQAGAFFRGAIEKGLDSRRAYFRMIDAGAKTQGMAFEEMSKDLETSYALVPRNAYLSFMRRALKYVRKKLRGDDTGSGYEKHLDVFISEARKFLTDKGVRTIFELGARDCTETLVFRKNFPDANIYTFECNPETLPICRKKVAPYPKIHLIEKAVSDTNGHTSFFQIDNEKTKTVFDGGNPGASSLFRANDEYELEKYVQKEIRVETISLDTFLGQNSLKEIDLLWMDIQGAELKALQGLGKRISAVKLIHFETEFFPIYVGQPLFTDMRKFLNKNGFRLSTFTSVGKYAADVLFVRKDIASGLMAPEWLVILYFRGREKIVGKARGLLYRLKII
jgi:FkbM family methyltransferase